MAKKEKRFVVKEEQSFYLGALMVVVDTATGVNYLVTYGSGASGITPLLDANGNVVIDSAARYMPE
ncbi:MAG TPA: hypothetical protein IAC18_01870 [Candidatus Scatomorpha merdipullorum]|uniref:DUF6440 domain-containing protein n=1 Tax=Candidatus Scatomorpha merdipullorum TaxID=2840927 RepID=A0A9D1FCB7_9FIRM|nr:hypothetical protein [Candidatus Scatomorpha merdipullorum]